MEFELDRQARLSEQGLPVIQETLGWDEAAGETVPQRSKEEAHDYRYFPEPDLPPLILAPDWIGEIRVSLPELPLAKQQRFVREMGLSPYQSRVISAERDVAEFFEAAVAAVPELTPSKLANWVTSDLFGALNEVSETLATAKITPAALARLVVMVEQGEINTTSAKVVLGELVNHGGDPAEIVAERGVAIVNDRPTIHAWVTQVIKENPAQVAEYRAGKKTLEKWLLGQVMRAAGGRAEPALARTLLLEALAGTPPDQTG